MYILLRRWVAPGYNRPYFTVLESENLNKIVEKFKRLVRDGCPVDDLKIVKDQPFEFKCGLKFKDEEEA